MSPRTLQLVLHYDGAGFAGWQRQPDSRTVQGCLEEALGRLCSAPVPVLGAGRTDAGVHARGQACGIRVPERWTAAEMRRALNAILPRDIWVSSAHVMQPEFHARYDAVARRYRYKVGLDEEASSPFRSRWEWAWRKPVSREALHEATSALIGTHIFRAFAVRGTAPEHDDHRCTVTHAEWNERDGGLDFTIEANRFLHHMVRFITGTLMNVASGRRPASDIATLLEASDNQNVSPPAPAHALFLERVSYPPHCYLDSFEQ
ncbi:MAG TPA: tRNA pseudouridine(38-40) synthase TruA [Gemmatimonadales bacterium]|nr:tRNA pseudouridine(38-40) synthase TruA [Gemmatimonadales bacterium]